MKYINKKLACLLVSLGMLAGCASEPVEPGPSAATAKPGSADMLEPVLPEFMPYPMTEDYRESGNVNYEKYDKAVSSWYAQQEKLQSRSQPYQESLHQFAERMSGQLLNVSGDQNAVYSPLNIYIALSMLCEATDGDTREQIMDLLGAEDIAVLRAAVPALWEANYNTGDAVTSILSNSLWLDERLSYQPDFRQRLADYYYASSYIGDLDSDTCTDAFRNWLDHATGDLLKDQANGIKPSPDTVMILASAIYYRGKWASGFGSTTEEIFHAPAGDIMCDMMHSEDTGTVYYGKNWKAIAQYVLNSGRMWIVLPDEGTDVQDIVNDPAVRNMLKDPADCESRHGDIQLSVPKLDIVSDLDLKDSLIEMGITDVFDPETADYSPLSDQTDLYLDAAKHAARLKTDEDGIEAAAYTVLITNETAVFIDEPIEFTADRPFFFSLQAADGSPLFEGVVNTPK
ncbi:MAG: serpin family protein [Erysipelotrichaceae bacterium]|nr:serpin family protein [Erysipelotrichaceae bacterium]